MITDQLEEIVGPILATTVQAKGLVNALTVQIVDGSGVQVTSFGGAGGTASNFGSAFPSSGTAGGYTDGTNMRGAQVYLLGSDYVQGVSLRTVVGGVSQAVGTSSFPLIVQLASGGSTTVNGTYLSTSPTLTNGSTNSLLLDVSGNLKNVEQYAPQAEDNTRGVFAIAIKPLAVSTYSWTSFQNLAANATLNVKASTGNVKSWYCHNTGGSTAYMQLHNTATTPGGGAVPVFTFPLAAGQDRIVGDDFFGENGYNFSTGIAFAFSTTEATYTAGTAGNQVTQIMYN